MAGIRYAVLVLCALVAKTSCEECACNRISSVQLVDDAQVAAQVKQVRDEFLARQPSNAFTRLSATILMRERNTQTWRRGSVDGTRIDYPASTVKLMYMYAAIEWCKAQARAIDCLDRYVRPMVVVSSNLDTGYVVDAITNTSNIDDLTSANDTRWPDWSNRRLSVERLLQDLNLYGNQIVRSKTYPTNSGQSPIGSESVLLRNPSSRNMLQSCCTASFMLYLMQARPASDLQYMKSMLHRNLESDQTTFGNGLPAGTLLYSKSGNAYDTVEEIAHITLPTGREVILSAFSNGFQRPASDFYILGRFAEMLIEKLSLNSSATNIFTTDTPEIYNCTDAATLQTSALPKDNIGQSLVTFNGSCFIQPVLSERGVYTVSLWNPTVADATSHMNVAVMDAYNVTDGDDGYVYNQVTSASRWVSVGDFLLNPGRQTVYLKARNPNGVFNAIRFSLHPPLTTGSGSQSASDALMPYRTLVCVVLLLLTPPTLLARL